MNKRNVYTPPSAATANELRGCIEFLLMDRGFGLLDCMKAIAAFENAHGFDGLTEISIDDIAQEFMARDIGAGVDAWQRKRGIGRYGK